MDPSEHFLGLRLNMYVASVLTVVGVVWFIYSQRRGQPAAELPAQRPGSGADSTGTADSDPAGSSPAADSSPPGDSGPSGGLQSRGLERDRARHRHGLTATRTESLLNSINNELRARPSN